MIFISSLEQGVRRIIMSQAMNHHSALPAHRLLVPEDPAPVEIINADGLSSAFMLCEHAGRALPSVLAGLGLAAANMEKHIAWDIGAEGLARQLSERLDASLVLQRYSRLVIDTNRPFAAPDCIPEISDGVVIPGNAALDETARRLRYDEIHKPLHDTVATLLDRRAEAHRPGVLLTIHSFTPTLGKQRRDMSVGLLFNRDRRLADALQAALLQLAPDENIALNAPYSVDDDSDYAIPVHGEQRGIPHVLIELRNDLINDPAGQLLWAERLSSALAIALEKLEISR